MAFRLVALDHVQLAMPEGGEERAEAFYAGLLGLFRHEKPMPLAARGGCWFSTSAPDAPASPAAVVLHLGVEPDFRPARKAHPALVVDGYDELTERLATAGVVLRDDTELSEVRRCHLDDPFGNRIELIDAESPDPVRDTSGTA